MATRIVAGAVLVFGLSVLVARLAERRCARPRPADAPPPYRLAAAPRRFVLALARLAATLLPEYALVVFLLGLFRGWISPLGAGAARWGLLAVVAAAVLVAIVALPTGGEIPVVQGLALAGAAAGVRGALLVSLPAISLVSMAMVARELSLRVTLAAAGAVVVPAVGAGALLSALG